MYGINCEILHFKDGAQTKGRPPRNSKHSIVTTSHLYSLSFDQNQDETKKLISINHAYVQHVYILQLCKSTQLKPRYCKCTQETQHLRYTTEMVAVKYIAKQLYQVAYKHPNIYTTYSPNLSFYCKIVGMRLPSFGTPN